MALLGQDAARALVADSRGGARADATDALVVLAWQGLVPADLLPELSAMRERAWRCLSELTGRRSRRWDDWVEWWQSR